MSDVITLVVSLGDHWKTIKNSLGYYWDIIGVLLGDHWKITWGHLEITEYQWEITVRSLTDHWAITGRSLEDHWDITGGSLVRFNRLQKNNLLIWICVAKPG